MKTRLVGLVLGWILVGAAGFGQAPEGEVDRRAAAGRIDALIAEHLQATQRSPLPRADDATFLRRAYLGILGRIPSAAEAEAFLARKDQDRRHELVRELLAAPGFQSRFFHFWADLLRVKTRLSQRSSGEPYMHWLKEALAENRPYDVMVRQMLTAEGAAHARGNGATGYVLRDFEMPEDNMANTVRVFLGTRLECAMCHNHPSDKWTQKQFYEMAAFAGGLQYRGQNQGRGQQVGQYRDVVNQVREKHGQQGVQLLGLVMRTAAVGVKGTGTGLARLPKDYQYEDLKPESYVQAKAIFGPELQIAAKAPPEPRRGRARRNMPRRGLAMGAPEVGSREAFANWVASDDNPRFALVISNRLYKWVFGRGLIEPVDDLRDDTVAVAPELMRELESLMVALDYDLRAFLEILWMTEAAGRATMAEEPGLEAQVLAGWMLQRMSGEQLWDSMVGLVVPNLDQTLQPALSPRAELVYRNHEQLTASEPEELVQMVDLRMLQRSDPAAYRRALLERRQQNGEMQEALSERAELQRRLRAARRQGNTDEIAKIRTELSRLAALSGIGGLGGASLTRASDLPQPAPAGHFLRQFGQSDRETIEGAFSDPNVPQVLQLLNGFLEERVLRDEMSALALALRGAKNDEERLRIAYLGLLSREPTREEASAWRKEAKSLGKDLWPEVLWTLANLHEFRFIR